MLSLVHPRAWLAASAALVLAVVVASLLPSAAPLGTFVLGLDKLAHLATYLVLAAWFTGLYPRARYPAIALALGLLGVAIEAAQHLMGLGREADPLDVMANLTGLAGGLLLGRALTGGWAPRAEAWLLRRRAS